MGGAYYIENEGNREILFRQSDEPRVLLELLY
jgi:hypothetical protein